MKITLLWVGKTKDEYLKSAISDYASRIAHYNIFNIVEIKEAKSASVESAQKNEWEKISKLIPKNGVAILLDEVGKEYTSESFASFIEKKRDSSVSELIFIIGGAYGFPKDEISRFEKIALSKMTFTHQMVRLFFTEQLYRAFTIINNESYHH